MTWPKFTIFGARKTKFQKKTNRATVTIKVESEERKNLHIFNIKCEKVLNINKIKMNFVFILLV